MEVHGRSDQTESYLALPVAASGPVVMVGGLDDSTRDQEPIGRSPLYYRPAGNPEREAIEQRGGEVRVIYGPEQGTQGTQSNKREDLERYCITLGIRIAELTRLMDESIVGFAHLKREIGNRAQENQQVAEHISALEQEWQAWHEENDEHNQGEGEAKQELLDGLNALRDSVKGIASGLGHMQTKRLLGRNTPEYRGGDYEGKERRIAELEVGVRNLCQDVGRHMQNSDSDMQAVQALQGTQGTAEEKIAGLWTRAVELEAEIRLLQNEIQTLHQNQKEIVAEIGKMREELQHLHHTAARQEQAREQLHQESGGEWKHWPEEFKELREKCETGKQRSKETETNSNGKS